MRGQGGLPQEAFDFSLGDEPVTEEPHHTGSNVLSVDLSENRSQAVA